MSEGTNMGSATADAILKQYYDNGIIEPQFIKETPTLSQIEGSNQGVVMDGVGGAQVVFPLFDAPTQGLGARGFGEPNPKPRSQQYVKCNFPVRKHVARVRIQGELWRASLNAGPKAFASLITTETENQYIGFAKDMNAILLNNSVDGQRCTVTTGSAGGTGVSIIVDKTQSMFDDMMIDVYTAGGLQKATEIVVTSVDRDTNTLVLEDTAGVVIAATDVIYRNGNKGKEIAGFPLIVNDTSGVATLQGVSVADHARWRSLVLSNGGTARPLTLDLLEQAFLKSFQQDHTPPDLIVMNADQRRAYANLLVPDKRFTIVNGGKKTVDMDGGYANLSYNEVSITSDWDAPLTQVLIAKKKYLKLYRQTGFRWMASPDMKNIWMPVQGMDAYEATAYWEGEFATKRRNAHVRITDLA